MRRPRKVTQQSFKTSRSLKIWSRIKWQVTRSCLTLCNPMDCSPPGSSVHGIFQARMLEWVAIPSSRGLNLGLLHCRQILCQLRNAGSPKINNHYVLFIFGNMEGRSNLVSEGSNQINTKREREHLRWEGALAYSHSPFESHSVIFGPQTIPEGAWGKIFIICIKDEENEA